MNKNTSSSTNTSDTPATGVPPTPMLTRWTACPHQIFTAESLRPDPPVPTVTPPCPSWCEEDDQHPFDVDMSRGAEPIRWHVASFTGVPAGPVAIDVTQEETTAPDGLSNVHLGTAAVVVYGNCEELSSIQARALGLALNRAADFADDVSARTAR